MTARIVDGLLYGADETVAKWVNKMCGDEPKIDVPCAAIGLVKDNSLAGGVVFYNQRGNDIQMALAFAGSRMVRPQNIARAIGYVFTQLGLTRITAEIELDNVRSAIAATRLGFVREGVKRRAGVNGGHVGVYGLLKKDFKLKGYLA